MSKTARRRPAATTTQEQAQQMAGDVTAELERLRAEQVARGVAMVNALVAELGTMGLRLQVQTVAVDGTAEHTIAVCMK